jgi:hypothetical protein
LKERLLEEIDESEGEDEDEVEIGVEFVTSPFRVVVRGDSVLFFKAVVIEGVNFKEEEEEDVEDVEETTSCEGEVSVGVDSFVINEEDEIDVDVEVEAEDEFGIEVEIAVAVEDEVGIEVVGVVDVREAVDGVNVDVGGESESEG